MTHSIELLVPTRLTWLGAYRLDDQLLASRQQRRARQPPHAGGIRAHFRVPFLVVRDRHHHLVVCAPPLTSTILLVHLMFRTHHFTRPPDPSPARGHGTSLDRHHPPGLRLSCAMPKVQLDPADALLDDTL